MELSKVMAQMETTKKEAKQEQEDVKLLTKNLNKLINKMLKTKTYISKKQILIDIIIQSNYMGEELKWFHITLV